MSINLAKFVLEVEPTESLPEDTPGPRSVCVRCFSSIRYNRVLRVSFCPIHGFSAPFTFFPFSEQRLRGV